MRKTHLECTPTKIVRTLLITTFFGISTASATAATKGAAPICKDVLSSSNYVTSRDFYRLPRLRSIEPKGAYEKTEDYRLRVKREIEQILEEGKQAANKVMNNDLILGKLDFWHADTEYDADKETLTISSLVRTPSAPLPVEFLGTKREVSSFTSERSTGQETTYKLGTVQASSTSFGIAYTTRLKNKYLKGTSRKISFKISPKRAIDARSSLILAVAGPLIPPYSFSRHGGYDDYSNMKMTSYSANYVVLDVVCAAIIDTVTKEVLLELN